jgi:hypothetical protein
MAELRSHPAQTIIARYSGVRFKLAVLGFMGLDLCPQGSLLELAVNVKFRVFIRLGGLFGFLRVLGAHFTVIVQRTRQSVVAQAWKSALLGSRLRRAACLASLRFAPFSDIACPTMLARLPDDFRLGEI